MEKASGSVCPEHCEALYPVALYLQAHVSHFFNPPLPCTRGRAGSEGVGHGTSWGSFQETARWLMLMANAMSQGLNQEYPDAPTGQHARFASRRPGSYF